MLQRAQFVYKGFAVNKIGIANTNFVYEFILILEIVIAANGWNCVV